MVGLLQRNGPVGTISPYGAQQSSAESALKVQGKLYVREDKSHKRQGWSTLLQEMLPNVWMQTKWIDHTGD